MIKRIVMCAAIGYTCCATGARAQEMDTVDGPLLGVCNLQAIAFANPTFNTTQAAQDKCDELVAQVNGDRADCTVVRGQGNKRVAKFRKLFNVNNLNVNQLLQQLTIFVLNNNIFGTSQIKMQLAVTNGCG